MTNTLDPTIFRAYDIRGVVGETLTEENVFLIGKALGSMVLAQSFSEIIIARDGRLSGPALSSALSTGILSSGCDVLDVGCVPTPVLYYATSVLGTRSGVMVTGSHNPANYNGLKMVINGVTLTENEIKSIYQRIIDKQFHEGIGQYRAIEMKERYLSEVTSHLTIKRPLRVVIDAGNGVSGELAPRLFRALGCHVYELFCEIDGTFPNHHPDPSQKENLEDLIRVVQETKADIGLAFDGDGDRLGVVTNKGNVIWSDRLLMLFAASVLADQPGANIIYDVKCTHHLAGMIRSVGGEPVMWKTGHSLIKAKMAEMNAPLAGEMSGHFFFKDRWYGFDDALYAGARLLEILAKSSLDADTIFSAIPNSINTPELKIYVDDAEKFFLMKKLIENAQFPGASEVMTIDGLRVNFADGWGLVRPSNTTPCLILRFEALNQTILDHIQGVFRHWMLSIHPDLVLPF